MSMDDPHHLIISAARREAARARERLKKWPPRGTLTEALLDRIEDEVFLAVMRFEERRSLTSLPPQD